MSNKSSYLQVDQDFIEILSRLIDEGKSGKVHFFTDDEEVNDASGSLLSIIQKKKGEYLALGDDQEIRLDKIVTVLGKPGPAYEEYERFANACLSCEDLGQFYSSVKPADK